MRVALLNEGTYPFAPGGVSVWCDQLIRGLPEHEFLPVTLTAGGQDHPTWARPANAAPVQAVPLWVGRPRGTMTGNRSRVRKALAGLALSIALPSEHPRADAEFTSALRALHEVGRGATEVATFHAVLRDGSLEESLLAARGAGAITASVADALAAAELIRRSLLVLAVDLPDVDLCHAVVNGPAALMALAQKWRLGTPYVLSEHGVYLRERYLALHGAPLPHGAKRLVMSFLRRLSRICYAEASLILPVTRFNRRWEERHGADPARIITIGNGVDPVAYPRLDTEPSVPTISWVGRVDPLKDLDTLIRAFATVHDAEPLARLRLFGPCPPHNEDYLEHCQQLIASLGLDRNVTFEGPVDSSRQAFEAGHVVALSSISEGMPYTLVEAMMSGRPTVSTDVGGVLDTVGDAGIVVAPRDADAFGWACLHLLHDAQERRRLGELARRRALARFTLEEAMDCYRLLYDVAAADVVRRAPRAA